MELSDDNEAKLDEIIEKLKQISYLTGTNSSSGETRMGIQDLDIYSVKYIIDPLDDLIYKITKYKDPYMDRRPTPNRDKIEYRFNELLKNIDLSELSYRDDFREGFRNIITELKRDFFNIYDSSEPNYDSGIGGKKRKSRKTKKTRKFRKSRKTRKSRK
jgi:hypothetical protein